MPRRFSFLPKDRLDRPIPWHATMVDGEPDYAAIDPVKAYDAWGNRRCWLCGTPRISRSTVYVVQPVAALLRLARMPSCHLLCAAHAARHRPYMIPSKAELCDPSKAELCAPAPASEPKPAAASGNVFVLWTTRTDEVRRQGPLVVFDIGAPEACVWLCDGRPATLAEASTALAAAASTLTDSAAAEGEAAMSDLLGAVQQLLPLMPSAPPP